jgi:hypothetical protein
MRQMIRRHPGRCALLIGSLAFCLTLWVGILAPSRGSESRIANGPEEQLFGGRVATWAAFDAAGALREAGLTLPYAVVEHAPEEPGPDQKTEITLDFPAEVKRAMSLDHLELLWQPAGRDSVQNRDPGRFDLRFVEVAADAHGAGCRRFEQREPDPAQAEGLDKVMVAGTDDGRLCFVEPMISRAALEKRHSFSLTVPVPPGRGQAAPYPHRLEAIFDRDQDAYRIFVSDFRPIA